MRRSLREAHRLAKRIEIIEVRWHGPREATRKPQHAERGSP